MDIRAQMYFNLGSYDQSRLFFFPLWRDPSFLYCSIYFKDREQILF
jgi:hypothetical protein